MRWWFHSAPAATARLKLGMANGHKQRVLEIDAALQIAVALGQSSEHSHSVKYVSINADGTSFTVQLDTGCFCLRVSKISEREEDAQ